MTDDQEPGRKPPPLPPDSPPAQTEQTPPTPETALCGKRIVVCEDEGMTQMYLQRVLTRAGLVIAAAAGDGRAGVGAVLRERPDLVLMDVQMPVMDGLEAARQILTQFRVCIVMLTAFSTPEYEESARALGVAGYAYKPVISGALLSQLQQAYAGFHA